MASLLNDAHKWISRTKVKLTGITNQVKLVFLKKDNIRLENSDVSVKFKRDATGHNLLKFEQSPQALPLLSLTTPTAFLSEDSRRASSWKPPGVLAEWNESKFEWTEIPLDANDDFKKNSGLKKEQGVIMDKYSVPLTLDRHPAPANDYPLTINPHALAPQQPFTPHPLCVYHTTVASEVEKTYYGNFVMPKTTLQNTLTSSSLLYHHTQHVESLLHITFFDKKIEVQEESVKCESRPISPVTPVSPTQPTLPDLTTLSSQDPHRPASSREQIDVLVNRDALKSKWSEIQLEDTGDLKKDSGQNKEKNVIVFNKNGAPLNFDNHLAPINDFALTIKTCPPTSQQPVTSESLCGNFEVPQRTLQDIFTADSLVHHPTQHVESLLDLTFLNKMTEVHEKKSVRCEPRPMKCKCGPLLCFC